jgi:hypothetical protein
VWQLCSRRWVPAELDPAGTDRRRLGVAVWQLWLDDTELSLSDDRLGEGWHDAERGWRWSDGQAAIRLTAAGTLRVAIRPWAVYRLPVGSTPAAARC